ncbi:hypothetical protein CA51_31120 [Rosistilla oblonga]|nr:hypothetical protein CA51_31120 [Rosistilla oblonga]
MYLGRPPRESCESRECHLPLARIHRQNGVLIHSYWKTVKLYNELATIHVPGI